MPANTTVSVLCASNIQKNKVEKIRNIGSLSTQCVDDPKVRQGYSSSILACLTLPK